MAVDVGVRDLIRSYARLRDSATQTSGSAASLLLCYGVVCGMKAAYLKRVSARGTQDLPPDVRNHDLRNIAKKLRLDASHTSQLIPCRRGHTNQARVEPHHLHEAWRYGAVLHDEDERCALEALEKLSKWCREEHSR